MGFVSDVLGTGNSFHATAPINNFGAFAAQNGFQGRQADLQQQNFQPGMQQALQGAMGQGPQSSLQQQQGQFADALRQQAAGGGPPSIAQQQLQQGLAANQNQAASLIGSQRGINPALAARLVGQNQAQAGQQFAGQQGMLRSQEMLNAQGMLGNALSNQRGQDLQQQGLSGSLYGMMGGLQQGQNSLNLQNFQGMQGMNLQSALANQQAMMGAQGINAGVAAGNQGAQMDAQHINAGVAAGNQSTNAGIVGGLLSGGGAALSKALAHGGPVDSTTNDTVPAMLSPGEIVLPKSVAQAEDAPEKAAAFVKAIRRQKGPEGGYGAVLAKVRELKGHMDRLEKMCAGGVVK